MHTLPTRSATRSLRRRCLPALLASATLVSAAITAGAAGTSSAQPAINATNRATAPHGYFEYTAAPGTTIHDAFLAANEGTGAGDFALYGADGETSPNTGVVYATLGHRFPDGPSGNGEYGAGRWINVSKSHLMVAAHGRDRVPFSITVPVTAPAGDWVGSVSVDDLVPQGTSGGHGGGPSLVVTTRATMAVVVHISGPSTYGPLSIGQPSVVVLAGSRQAVDIPLRYQGNRLYKPYFKATIVDPHSGHVVARLDTSTWPGGTFDTFVPMTTLHYQWNLETPLPTGTYTIDIFFGDRHHPVHATYPLTVSGSDQNLPYRAQTPATALNLNWLIIVFIVVIVVLFMLMLIFFILWRRRSNEEAREKQVASAGSARR